MAAVRAHLRLVGAHSDFCCLAALCIGGMLPYLLFNSSNLNYLDWGGWHASSDFFSLRAGVSPESSV